MAKSKKNGNRGKKAGPKEKHVDTITEESKTLSDYADSRSRALGLLLEYVTTRCDVGLGDIGKELGINLAALQKVRQGLGEFDDEQERLVANYIQKALVLHPVIVTLDYHLIQNLLLAAQIKVPLRGELRDERVADYSFLRSMNIHFASEDGHEVASRDLFDRIGGAWCLLRREPLEKSGNSDSELRYSAALLNIKPQQYVSKRADRREEYVRTVNLHFALKARVDGRKPQAFQGQVLSEKKDHVHLIGSREGGNTPIVMALKWSDDSHPPQEFDGIALTAVSAPVVGFRLTDIGFLENLGNSVPDDVATEGGENTDTEGEDETDYESVPFLNHDLALLRHKSVQFKAHLEGFAPLVVDGTKEELEALFKTALGKDVVTKAEAARIIGHLGRRIADLESLIVSGAQQGYFSYSRDD